MSHKPPVRMTTERFDRLMSEQRSQWQPMTGGLSNTVFAFHDTDAGEHYIIKLISKQNDQLFVDIDQFFSILDVLPTTLYVNKSSLTVVEQFLSGDVIRDEYLFDKRFFPKILTLTDEVSLLSSHVRISRENIVLRYLIFLRHFLDKDMNGSCVIVQEIESSARQSLSILSKAVVEDSLGITFNHMDIQKYNILIDPSEREASKDDQDEYACTPQLIDWEYAGFTFEYFDIANILVLLINAFLESVLNEDIGECTTAAEEVQGDEHLRLRELWASACPRRGFHWQQDFLPLALDRCTHIREDKRREYLLHMMLVVCYLWGLWAEVKLRVSQDRTYARYEERMCFVAQLVVAEMRN